MISNHVADHLERENARLAKELSVAKALACKLLVAIESHKKAKWDNSHCRHDEKLWEVLK